MLTNRARASSTDLQPTTPPDRKKDKQMEEDMNYDIAVVKGDGIGPEVVTEAIKVLDKIGEKYGHTFHYNYVLPAALPSMQQANACRRIQ